MVVVEPELLPNVWKAAQEFGLSRDRILIFDNHGQKLEDGFRSWRVLFEHGESDWPRFDDLETAQNTTAALLFSSGTTGEWLQMKRLASWVCLWLTRMNRTAQTGHAVSL